VEIEGKFGQANRRFSLGRVMSKLDQTAQTAIAITFLVLNLERWLRCLLAFLLWLFAFTLVPIAPKNVLQRSLNRVSRQRVSQSPCTVRPDFAEQWREKEPKRLFQEALLSTATRLSNLADQQAPIGTVSRIGHLQKAVLKAALLRRTLVVVLGSRKNKTRIF